MADEYAICVRVDEAFVGEVPSVKLREAVAHTLKRYDAQSGTELSLLVTDDDAVQALNARFRGVGAPTDVLSFPAGDEPMPGMEAAPYLGDIIIAYPYTAKQAAADGHDMAHVLVLLAVHGALHLLGFDHDTAARQSDMWAAQREILAALDVPTAVIPPEYDIPEEQE